MSTKRLVEYAKGFRLSKAKLNHLYFDGYILDEKDEQARQFVNSHMEMIQSVLDTREHVERKNRKKK